MPGKYEALVKDLHYQPECLQCQNRAGFLKQAVGCLWSAFGGYLLKFTGSGVLQGMSLVQERRNTRRLSVGKVVVGDGQPVAVQSMTNTQTGDVTATLAQIHRLEAAGCEIVRVAVPDMEAALSLAQICPKINIPVIADIHFDYRLAVASVESGADGLRINPGNIGEPWKIREVVNSAAQRGVSIRIGVNAGSLDREIVKRLGPTPAAMVESAVENIRMLEDLGFNDIKVSLKASDVARTVAAYRLIGQRTDVPQIGRASCRERV